MKIIFQSAGRRFNNHWIFRNFNYKFSENKSYIISGSNGSGKTSLLRVIAGQLSLSEGEIQYFDAKNLKIDYEKIYQSLSWSGPYLQLYEELSITEAIKMHFRFKKNMLVSFNEVIERLLFQKHSQKQLKHLSSGMLQRLKVGLAIFSDTPLLLLDEPTANLDVEMRQLIHDFIREFSKNRTMILASNQEDEVSMFETRINLNDLKSLENEGYS